MVLRTLGELALSGTPLRRPKPLLLLTYLAFEGPTPRRKLAELFFGDVKDPHDSLSTTLKYLKQHPASALQLQPKMVATEVTCDALVLLEALSERRIPDALELYQGPFLATHDLSLGEELEDWLYSQQDFIAQRLQLAVLEHAETQAEIPEGVRLVERAWRLTKEQGIDAPTLGRLYHLLVAGGSPLCQDVRRYASEYGMPLELRSPASPAEDRPALHGGGTPPVALPSHALNLTVRLEELRHSTEGLALGLWGEPGIGKSWTVEQVSSALSFPVYRVLAAVQPAYLSRHLPRAAALPEWARTTLSRLSAERPVEPVAAADALAALLAAHAPILLHVEDLHEAGEEGLALWISLARSVQRSPGVGLLVTGRQPPPDAFEPELLPPLTQDETGAMLEDEAGSPLPTEGVGWIYTHTLGNPLFSLEFYRYLRKRGNLWHDGRAWRWRSPAVVQLPANVETLISEFLARLDLDEDIHTLMRVKALLPVGTPLAMGARVVGLDGKGLERAKRRLTQDGIFRGDRFVHPLYREVLNQTLALTERRRLARRIVEALSEAHPEGAAPFAADAGLSGEGVVDLLTRAAEYAVAHGRVRQAGEMLAAAAEHAEGVAKQTLLLRAAEVASTYLESSDDGL
jgi:hypothetical protein